MSPSWRDHIRIGFAPDRVAVVRVGRGLRPAVNGKLSARCEPVAEGADWAGALVTLEESLSRLRPQGARATVVLSHRLVRYVLLPASAKVARADESETLARFWFERTYGAFSGDWLIRVSDDDPNRPRVASAVEAKVVDALRATVARSGARLVSMQPHFMTAYNQWRLNIGKRDCWFVALEPGRAVAANVSTGAFRALRSFWVSDDAGLDLMEHLARENTLAGEGNPPVHVLVHAPEFADLQLPAREGLAPERLDLPVTRGFLPVTDYRCAMAMGGL